MADSGHIPEIVSAGHWNASHTPGVRMLYPLTCTESLRALPLPQSPAKFSTLCLPSLLGGASPLPVPSPWHLEYTISCYFSRAAFLRESISDTVGSWSGFRAELMILSPGHSETLCKCFSAS